MILSVVIVVLAFKNLNEKMDEKNFADIEKYIDMMKLGVFAMFCTFAYSFNSSTFCATLVLEREKRLKYALNVMGCRIVPYWLGTLKFYNSYFFIRNSHF